MYRILFVDDDPLLLSTLARCLRSMRKQWHVAFVTSGAEALQRLETDPFDVVVSDMQMPLMDGLTLLAEVKQRHPTIVRIMLSSESEPPEVATSSLLQAFLAKPCTAEVLQSTIERLCPTAPCTRDGLSSGAQGRRSIGGESASRDSGAAAGRRATSRRVRVARRRA
jgi:CheY-like chemotaxis protein